MEFKNHNLGFKAASDSDTTFSKLPIEIQCQIWGFLDRPDHLQARLVCLSWSKEIKLRFCKLSNNPGTLNLLQKSTSHQVDVLLVENYSALDLPVNQLTGRTIPSRAREIQLGNGNTSTSTTVVLDYYSGPLEAITFKDFCLANHYSADIITWKFPSLKKLSFQITERQNVTLAESKIWSSKVSTHEACLLEFFKLEIPTLQEIRASVVSKSEVPYELRPYFHSFDFSLKPRFSQAFWTFVCRHRNSIKLFRFSEEMSAHRFRSRWTSNSIWLKGLQAFYITVAQDSSEHFRRIMIHFRTTEAVLRRFMGVGDNGKLNAFIAWMGTIQPAFQGDLIIKLDYYNNISGEFQETDSTEFPIKLVISISLRQGDLGLGR